MRTIAIGDIHGCSKALFGLLEVIAPTAQDRLIFLGDYVDRGPDSRGVIDRLISLQQECQTVYLLGNHEIMFRGALRGLDPLLWLQQGGSQTITSYGGLLEYVPVEHREFLDRCIPFYETSDAIYVHANYLADLPLSNQPEEALFWEHLHHRFPERHVSGKQIYCGHTPQRDGKIGYYGHLTCLDTYCFGGLYLSALEVTTKEEWQVSREGHLQENWRGISRLWAKWRAFAKLRNSLEQPDGV